MRSQYEIGFAFGRQVRKAIGVLWAAFAGWLEDAGPVWDLEVERGGYSCWGGGGGFADAAVADFELFFAPPG